MTEVPILIFDGDCAFCTSSVTWSKRLIKRLPTTQPYQFTDLAALGLTAEQCNLAVQYVDAQRRVQSGEDAVRAVLLASGRGWWLLGVFLGLPGIHWLSGVVYRWVARNRQRLPGGTAACALPPREPR